MHLILDNYATHKHPDMQRWLARHKRFHLHFTPTSSSWLNLVERWFRERTDKALHRGSFNSAPELITVIEGFPEAHNEDPKPFVWTAAESNLAKVRRGRLSLQQAVNQRWDTPPATHRSNEGRRLGVPLGCRAGQQAMSTKTVLPVTVVWMWCWAPGVPESVRL